jgi:hypothetical protein
MATPTRGKTRTGKRSWSGQVQFVLDENDDVLVFTQQRGTKGWGFRIKADGTLTDGQ